MFPPTDNPAQRLLDLLNRARSIGNKPAIQVWADVLELPNMDVPTFYRVLGHLNYLVDSIETRIRQLPELNHTLYLRDLPTIRSVICPDHVQRHWHDFKGPFDHGVLTGLEFCANELSKRHAEDPIPPDELQKIRQECSELFESVSAAEISPGLKLILFDILTSAVLAIDQYKILGNDGLKRAVAYTVGMLTLHKDEFLGAKNETFVKRAFAVIKHLCDAINVAYRAKQLGGAMHDILHLQ